MLARPYLLLPLLALLTGCTQYEFDLVEPADLATHVGRKKEGAVTVERAPLQYRLQSYENRLVMQVSNPTDQAVELLENASYVVDPEGQSHALKGQSIAAHSYIKLIFPPLYPYYYYSYPPGPIFGWNITYSGSYYYGGAWPYPYYPYGYYPYYPYGYAGPLFYDTPLNLADYGEPAPSYWEWKDQTSIRLRLAYRRGEETFQHDFVFQRVKVAKK